MIHSTYLVMHILGVSHVNFHIISNFQQIQRNGKTNTPISFQCQRKLHEEVVALFPCYSMENKSTAIDDTDTIYRKATMKLISRFISKRCICTGLHLAKSQPDPGLPPPLVHATGLERRELLALLRGDDDPYFNGPHKRTTGTRNDPNLIRSAFQSRMVGCVCEPEQYHIVWMWVEAGMPRRCMCGHWFKLVNVPPL